MILIKTLKCWLLKMCHIHKLPQNLHQWCNFASLVDTTSTSSTKSEITIRCIAMFAIGFSLLYVSLYVCLFGFYVFCLKNVLFVVVLLGATKLRLPLFGQCPNRGDMNFKGASLRFFVCLCPFVCMFVCLLACLFLFLSVCLDFMFFCL